MGENAKVSLVTNLHRPRPGIDEAVAGFPARYARTARFTLGTPRNIRVTGDGSRILFCRSKESQDAVLCLWSLDVATGAERLVVDPANLSADGAELPPAERARRERARESASGIVAYGLDDGGRQACFALAGALFVVDVASGELRSLDVAGSVFDPRLNRPGTAVAYVDGASLRVVELSDDGSTTDRLLRADDDPAVSYGRAEFIAGEEMGRGAGYWWSPDGRQLLVSRVDENPVGTWWIADPANPERTPQAVRYPAAGTANAVVGLELIGLDGAGQRIEWDGQGRYEYLADVIWSADHPPLIVRQTRDQRTVSLAELTTGPNGTFDGGVAERHLITDDTWVELVPGSPTWSPAGLLTVEDHGGRRRLMLDGQALTGDQLDVRSVVGLVDYDRAVSDAGGPAVGGDAGDPAVGGGAGGGGQAVVVTAWTVPSEIHVALVPLIAPSLVARSDGDVPATIVLTSEPGVHGAVIDGTTLVVVFSGSTSELAARTTVHRLEPTSEPDPDGGPGPGQRLSSPLGTVTDHGASAGFEAAPLFCQLGPDRLETALFLPTGHDGSSPLPVLLDPYGGPHAQRVLKNHNPHLVSRWFAEHGYAVVVTDGRGTPGRGPDWERAVWGDLAGPVLDDQLAALDAALERYPFLDRQRVGIRGWSFGGFLAALAVLRRPDRFHAAVAGAPVTDWQLYDTHYTEHYLGRPDTHPDHYRRSSLWYDTDHGPQIPALERPLLLIHGLADDNVVAAHTLRFSTALLATGSPHRVLPLSGVTHMTPQVAVAENMLRFQLDFLDEVLG